MLFFNSEFTHGDKSQYPYLITGCDSGFGMMVASSLASQGFPVYAGCLTEEGMNALNDLGHPTLFPVSMNVCSSEDVDKVIKLIKKKENSLYCIINNAGIADGSILEISSMESWEKTIQVNLIGAMRVSRASIPLLREFGPGSRIINISSAASFAYLPGMSAYCASKAGIRIAGDAMRLEMQPFGIHVTSVMPGFFKTNIVTSPRQTPRDFKNAPREIQEVYGEEIFADMLDSFEKRSSRFPDPRICAEQIEKVSRQRKPPCDRPIGYDSYWLWWIF